MLFDAQSLFEWLSVVGNASRFLNVLIFLVF